MRASTTGKAREVLDLEQVNGGNVTQLLVQLNYVVNAGQPRQVRDQVGGDLYIACCHALALAVRLTPAKRLEIAERVDAEAKMHHDTVAEAEAFLGRWRRARHLLYREQLVGPPSQYVEQQMLAAGTDVLVVNAVVQQLRSSERREMNKFLEERISPSIYSLIKSREGTPEEPQNVEQAMQFVERWIVMHRSAQHAKGGRVGAVNADGSSDLGNQSGAGSLADVSQDTGAAYDSENWPSGSATIAGMNQNANAGNLSAFGKRADPRGKGAGVPNKPATGPPCPTCHGYHPDLKACPTHLARQDATFKPTPGANCHWCSGGVTCGGQNHFSRHHRAQWVAEHPGTSLPARPKGKGRGKGAKGKGKGRFAGKGRRRVSVVCEDGTELVWDEEEEEEEDAWWDEDEDHQGDANGEVGAVRQEAAATASATEGQAPVPQASQPSPAAADGSGCRNITMSTPPAAVQTEVAYPTEHARLQAQAAVNAHRARAVEWSN